MNAGGDPVNILLLLSGGLTEYYSIIDGQYNCRTWFLERDFVKPKGVCDNELYEILELALKRKCAITCSFDSNKVVNFINGLLLFWNIL